MSIAQQAPPTRRGVSRKTSRPLSGVDAHDAAAAGLAGLLVLSFGLSDGGYFGRGYTTLTVLLAAVGALVVVAGVASRPSRAATAVLGAMSLLAAWVGL